MGTVERIQEELDRAQMKSATHDSDSFLFQSYLSLPSSSSDTPFSSQKKKKTDRQTDKESYVKSHFYLLDYLLALHIEFCSSSTS